MQLPLIYRPKPIFGLDIGRTSVKVTQIKPEKKSIKVSGYGFSHFDKSATKEGVLVRPDVVATTIRKLFAEALIGKITTDRVAASLPISHIYTRILELPNMAEKDMEEAVKLEAEQYVPLSSNEIYIEYKLLGKSGPQTVEDAQKSSRKVLMVATPRRIIDSYLEVFSNLKLDVISVEPNMFANIRSVNTNCHTDKPKIVIDFGAQSSDMAIIDKHPLLISTVSTGGDKITNTIAKTLNLSGEQALQLKIRYGIAKSRWQSKLASALQPILSDFANEVQKMVRYHHDHTPMHNALGKIFLVGGGANMPGLADFLTHLTGIEVSICNPWNIIDSAPLQPPPTTETTIYATAIGLAMKEVTAND